LAKEEVYRSKARTLHELNTANSSTFVFVSLYFSRKRNESVPSKFQQCVQHVQSILESDTK